MLKKIAIALIAVLVINMLLLALVRGYVPVFWMVIGITAAIAYLVLPRMKEWKK